MNVLVDVFVIVGVALVGTGDGVNPLVAVGVREGVSVEGREGVTVSVGITVAAFVDVTIKVERGVGVNTVGGGGKSDVGVTVGIGVVAPIRTWGGISGGWY